MITRLRNLLQIRRGTSSRQADRIREALSENPSSAELHFELAKWAYGCGNQTLAYGEAKTAQFLGLAQEDVQAFLTLARSGLPQFSAISHNEYFRYATLADEIADLSSHATDSVLDVGGGNGALAQLVPDHPYCLAEPSINGISGLDLPFAEHSFDFVVACHVLEHIPLRDRERFLDQLMARARKGLLLLNPFQVPVTKVDKRLDLIIEITGFDWAQEHRECELPTVEFVQDYARARNLKISTKPNGTMTTALSVVLMEYFATKSGHLHELESISQFLNSLPLSIHHSDTQPNAYLIYLQR